MRWFGLLPAIVGIALGDGGMVVPPGHEIMEYGQVAIIKHFDGVEELSIATQFHATSGFAWIVPLPSLIFMINAVIGHLASVKTREMTHISESG